MINTKLLKISYLSAFTVAAMLVYGSPANSARPDLTMDPDFMMVFPAGTACNFDLQIEGWGGNTHLKEFKDENDNTVRMITAGTGSALRFTNVDTGSTFSTKSNGATSHTTFNLDGSYTQKLTGHNVLFMFPTDNPPGPSTTLYVGRVIYTVDTGEVYTIQSTSGKATDICAALP